MRRLHLPMQTHSDWNWIKIVWPFVVTVILTLGFGLFSMDILSSGRALVAGEGHYSKAQKDAVTHLNRYVSTQQEADYRRFLLALAVPLGDRKARLALDLPTPDLKLARQGFLEGKNHPDDIPGAIRLYQRFRHVSFMHNAIISWAEADQLVVDLQTEAQQLRRHILAGESDQAALRASIEQIDLLNARLMPLGDAFSATLSNGTRQIGHWLIIITFLLSSGLLGLVLVCSRNNLNRIKRYENALRVSEGRFNLTMLNSSDGLWDWDRLQTDVYSSPRMQQLLGTQEAPSAALLLRMVHPGDMARVRDAMRVHLRQAQPYYAEFRILTCNGATRWVCCRAQSERNAKGKVMRIAGSLSDITDVKTAASKIEVLAFHDSLTQLPNRQLLMDRLQQVLVASTRSKKNGALLFIDLDNFKTLNDTQGHDRGDLLLQQVAARLVASVRGSDTVARLGGDEFVVLLSGLHSASREAALQAKEIGEKILSALSSPYTLAGHELHSSCSIGITLFDDPYEKMGEFLKRADLAMYQAKATGRNTLRFFDPQMQAVMLSRSLLVDELRQGLPKNQFVLHYQPQVNHAGQVTGVEALLRWQHPIRGIVAPQEFIPLAEKTGIIVPLGLWVLQHACWQLVAWSKRVETMSLSMAVNISVRQFRHPDFVAQVGLILDQTGARPQRLKLELPESLLVEDLELTITKMAALKARGVSFALDDFGTGYSSLYYLKRLPLDQLKIDHSFVRDVPDDAVLACTIVALARNLGLAVIAKGVETEGQRAFLAHNGCHAYQGYLFSAPLPLAELEQLMHASRSVSA